MSKNSALTGKVVAVPENRQLGILVELLRNRGASVIEVPLVAILDAPDPAPVLAWLRRFVSAPPDYFILLTGEGLKRLLALAGQHELEQAFVGALAGVTRVCRGPKPERVLRTLALAADIQGQEPTTEGIIASLDPLPLVGKRIAVQLYGEEPNSRLIDFLHAKGARIDTVAPYVYAGKEAEDKVKVFIETLARGEIDVLAFTSQPQYKRLVDVAKLYGIEAELSQGLERTLLAAVGPVVADQLRDAGLKVAIMPDRGWFMKPLVTAIVRHFERAAANPL